MGYMLVGGVVLFVTSVGVLVVPGPIPELLACLFFSIRVLSLIMAESWFLVWWHSLAQIKQYGQN